MGETSAIPVVDLGGDDRRDAGDIAADMMAAYGDVGFAYVTGHGVPPGLIAELFDASARFHALPLDEKMAIALDRNHRGYIPIGTSTDRNSELAEVTRPNQSASFMMMREAGPTDPDVRAGVYLAGPNQWPDVDGFRPVLEQYSATLTSLCERLVQLFALGLGDGAGELVSSFDPPTTWLRLLHYPPSPSDAPADLYGSAPHLDFGALTVLAQHQVGGLQVRTIEGDWVDVPPRPGALVMNTGRMMQVWSRGRLLATPHRVINTSGVERFSCPFFFDPHVSAVVAPLESTRHDAGGHRIEPVDFGQLLSNELSQGYEQHTREGHNAAVTPSQNGSVGSLRMRTGDETT